MPHLFVYYPPTHQNLSIMSTTFHPKVNFEAIIMVRLMCMSQASMQASNLRLERGPENRRDIWASTEDAYETLKSRKAWKI